MVVSILAVACFALPGFVVFLAGGFPFLRLLRDGASKNIQDLARVRLPMEDCGLCEEWREEDGFARRPVPPI